ncbi:type II secretion system F family protein [Tessaracoccus sp. MC1865]|uniref:type II secretion system F family protein n=1 Tax=Tessaracoccus sp. MC1865 TaxID=2760310 RepID=UPI0015FFFBA4|nr:type II secretion system F family protein [Tessaracoccus sp. MC1865]MBB1484589.1 type II secretion system F family protein [Tessaracoccus sp. MC1865]QTO38322.1 type II secretion system F family protein [Tessaracoccus sp. MC1865]
MPQVVYVSLALLVVGVAYLLNMLLAGEGRVQRDVRANLQRGLSATTARGTRVVAAPTLGLKLVGTRSAGTLDKLLMKAGRPAAWPLERVISVKMISTLITVALAFLVVRSNPSLVTVALGLFVVVFVFFLPELLLWNTGIKRREAVQLELPDVLDQMSIAVEAGLGFDAALVRVARNGRGVLAPELIRTLQDIQLGQQRRLAYLALADRLAVPELRRFIRSIIQAEEHGIALSEVLHSQAKEQRIARRQRAEHKAMEIPVKVVFPLILFLMPALMIVIMTPAALSIIEAFSR